MNLSEERLAAVDVLLSRNKPATPPRPGPERRNLAQARLSYAQERLWILSEMEPGSPYYNIPAVMSLKGQLNLEALQQSIRELVRRHEALRTRYVERANEIVQIIEPQSEDTVRVVDLTGLREESAMESMMEAATNEAQRGFDLRSAPVMRNMVIRAGDDDQIWVMNVHHIASDGWSAGIMAREIRESYDAYTIGERVELEEPAIQYSDYAEWQREEFENGSYADQLEYWKNRLAGRLPVIRLPKETAKSPGSIKGRVAGIEIGEEETERIRKLCRDEGVTLYMGMLGAFALLLKRYCGDDEIVVGSPIANRRLVDVEKLVGYFANTIALRLRVRGDDDVRRYLQHIRETTMGAYANQDVPFEKVLEVADAERGQRGGGILQVLFVLNRWDDGAIRLRGVASEIVEIDLGTSRFEMSMVVTELEKGMKVYVEYRSDEFEQGTVERMLAHFKNVVNGIARGGGDRRIGNIGMLSDDETCMIISEWNWRGTEDEAGVVGTLEQVARERADAIAVIAESEIDGEGSHVSYHRMMSNAAGIGAMLRWRGVTDEETVAVCVEKTARMAEAIVGVLAAGAAYMALDVEHPEERLRYMMNDSRVRKVLADKSMEQTARRLAADAIEIVLMDELKDEIPAEREEEKRNEIVQGLAYVIYTSGTTGNPKGVMITRANMLNALKSFSKSHEEFGTEGRVLQKTSLSFDVSVWEIFWPLISGGTVIVGRRGSQYDIGYIKNVMTDEQVTAINFVPSMLEKMIDAGGFEGVRSPRLVACGGEAMSDQLGDEFSQRVGVSLENYYGPTETTISSTFWAVEDGQGVKIGKPFANTRVYILDEDLEQAAVGVSGEIWIGGEGVARGYWGKADETAEKFMPDGHCGKKGERIYRTGDIGRRVKGGDIEFLGRGDEQVKLRGYRIELREIEAQLMRLEGVAQAAVVLKEEENGDKKLVGYVMPDEGHELQSGELKARLRERIPEFMTPAVIVIVNEMPYTENGKVDRRALASRAIGVQEEKRAVRKREMTPLEEMVAGIWEDVLGRGEIGLEDDFFDLGGHSLTVTQVSTRIGRIFGVKLPLQKIFEHPTVSGLARLLAETGGGSTYLQATPAERPGPARQNRLEARMSYSQERLWILSEMEPGSPYYNIPAVMRLSGPLSVNALQQSICELARRHEALRTTYREIGEDVAQIINPASPHLIRIVDVSELAVEERREAAIEAARCDAQHGFDLRCGPVMRNLVVIESEEERMWVMNVHHIASDGWSAAIMAQETSELYNSFTEGERVELEELKIQYADYAEWQREEYQAGAYSDQLEYWRRVLGERLPVLELPRDSVRRATGLVGAVAGRGVPSEAAGRMRKFCRDEGVTMYMGMLAVFGLLLSKYCGEEDLVIGTPIANRRIVEMEHLVGCFVNTVAVRLRVRGEQKVTDFLSTVRETTLGAYANQDAPFEKVVEALGDETGSRSTGIFQVMFSMNSWEGMEIRLNGLDLRMVEVELGTSRFELSMAVTEDAGDINIYVEYRSDQFERETMERLLRHYSNVMDEMTLGGGLRSIGNIGVLSNEEKQMIVSEWSWQREGEDDWMERGVVAILEAVRKQGEDRIAVIAESESLGERAHVSYDEMLSRAKRIGSALRKKGIREDEIVAVCLAKTTRMIETIVGVLSAGAAYVALDSEYPEERLKYMISDTAVRIVVTEGEMAEFAAGLAGDRARIALIETLDVAGREQSLDQDSKAGLGGDGLAYVIYTSGTTGKPKGVMISHAAMTNALKSFSSSHENMRLEGRVLQKASLSFDVSVWEIFWPLISGGTVVIGRKGCQYDIDYIAELMRDEQITVINFVPSMLEKVVEAGAFQSAAALSVVACGGESLSPQLANEFEQRVGIRLENYYGPTETTISSTFWPVSRSDRVKIGRPFANTRVYVLDRHLEPAANGVAGMIWIAGNGVARGYWDRSAETAERFLPDLHSGKFGERMYCTGDVGRYAKSGDIEFLGRVDQQVKLRGYRIELGEVENELMKITGVAQAAAILRDDYAGEKKLIAYVEPKQGAEIDGRRLILKLKGTLPDFMVPAAVTVLERLPLAPGGKVDKKALPAVENISVTDDYYISPRDAMELRMARLWEDLLQTAPISIVSSFFDIGGHSLLAVRLVFRIRETFGVALPVSSLFKAPTIRDLCRLMREEIGASNVAPVLQINRGDSGAPLFCVHAAGGGVLAYAELARAIEPRPLYGIQAMNSGSNESIEDMARSYLEAVRKVEPEGPYYLAGWSVGGILAFEMAQQLAAVDEPPALVALIDTMAPNSHSREARPDESTLGRAFLYDIARLGRPDLSDAMLEELERKKKNLSLSELFEELSVLEIVPSDITLEEMEQFFIEFKKNVEAALSYRARPYRGRVVLFRASGASPDSGSAFDGWNELARGGIKVYDLPGDHYTALRGSSAELLGGLLKKF